MQKALINHKVAILISNGFEQKSMIEAQKLLQDMGANVRVVSPEHGIVTGRDNQNWGHNFAVDQALNTALGADYDVLVIPGGRKSHDKLALTAHSRRFISSFMDAEKPVILIDDAPYLPLILDCMKDKTFAVSVTMQDFVARYGAKWCGETVNTDANVMSGMLSTDQESFGRAMVSFLMDRLVNFDASKQAA